MLRIRIYMCINLSFELRLCDVLLAPEVLFLYILYLTSSQIGQGFGDVRSFWVFYI
jgi:hypothetical protein